MDVDAEVSGDKALQMARKAMIKMQETIAQSGAAALCVRKLICSKRDVVACSAMDLIICMLEGGNLRVQQVTLSFASIGCSLLPPSTFFFCILSLFARIPLSFLTRANAHAYMHRFKNTQTQTHTQTIQTFNYY